MSRLNVDALRAQFPVLAQTVNGKPLVYLDNAATTQKPLAVLTALDTYYREYNSNVHRGAHALADRATAALEGARETVRAFVNANDSAEIIFTHGTTESVNLVAQSWARQNLRAGDEVLITALEHHANLVPWQQACLATGAKLQVAPIHDTGELDLDAFRSRINARTRLLACTHVSNALGTVNPLPDMIAAAKSVGALVLVDGAQAVSHLPVDVQALGCDFYAFSGHKVFGPTGIGVLWGKRELLEAMPPYQFGGEMIEKVTFEASTWNLLPYKFEAGTPHIAGIVGLGAALQWLTQQDRAALATHEHALLNAVAEQSADIPGLKLIGTARMKVAVFSFLLDGAHPNDVGTLLDQQGIAVRTGHHCTMPLMQRLGIAGTVRASFAPYNDFDDVTRFVSALRKVRNFL